MATKAELFFDIFARDRTGGTLGKVGKDAETLGTKFAHFGKIAAGVAAAGVVAFASQGVQSFLQFDDKMNQSLAIMGEVSGPMRAKMETAAREVGKSTRFGADQAAEAYFFLASAGLSAQQSLNAMPRVAKFATAGMFDLATATDLATDAQSALGLSVDDPAQNLANLNRIMDVMVKTNILANTSVEQLAEALTNRAAAAARSVGKDVEETSAVLAAFADQGTKGKIAGEKFSIVLRDLQSRALSNKEEFAELGVSVFDASGNVRNMADIIGDLERLLGGMSAEQAKATLTMLGFTDESMSALQSLIGTSDAIREYEAALRSAGGTTDEVTKKQLESFSARLDILKSRLSDFGMSVGEVLVNAAFEIGTTVQEMGRMFGELPEPIQASTTAITAIVVAAPLAVAAYKKVRENIDRLNTSYQAMSKAGKTATRAFGVAGLVLAAGATVLAFFARENVNAKQRVEEFTDAIKADSGAIGENTQKKISAEIAGGHLADSIEATGQSMDSVARAIAGNSDATQEIQQHTKSLQDEYDNLIGKEEALTGAEFDRAQELEALIGKSQHVEKETARLAESVSEAKDEVAFQTKVEKEVTDALTDHAGATDEVTSAARDSASAIEEEVSELRKLIDAADEAAGKLLGARDAEVRFEQAVDDAAEALTENGTTLDINTEKGRKNRTALDNIAEAALDQAAAMEENGASHDQVVKKMERARDEFIKTARQMGLSERQAKDLADRLGLVPGNYKATMSVRDNASRTVNTLNGKLSAFARTWTATARILADNRTPTGFFNIGPRAHGGPVGPGRTFLVGEEGPELVRFSGSGQVIPHDETMRVMRSPQASTAVAGTTAIQLVNHGVIGSKLELENWLVSAVDNARRKGRM